MKSTHLVIRVTRIKSRLHQHLLGFTLGFFLFSLAPGQVVGQCAGYKISAPDACTCDDPSGRTAVRIIVKGASGETWNVKNVIGLYDQMSPPPPAAPVLIPVGTQLPAFPLMLDSFYLDAFRLNNNGYWIQVTNGTCDLDIKVGNADCGTGLPSVDIDPDGTPNNGDEYTLYVHPTDNSAGIPWVDGPLIDIPGLPNLPSRPLALADFDGEGNTQTIVSTLGAGNYAAKLCADLVYNGCDDWYLPSLGELNAMYQQLGPGGNNNFGAGYYLSSTEFGFTPMWILDFSNNGYTAGDAKTSSYACRCVRK
ncbi:MAG: DUF1566 domain-containing protein [Bacteroidetes bacterium]|nr:MAG: DUF1566 domain-containing protein [Bacteroidota bacterium]